MIVDEQDIHSVRGQQVFLQTVAFADTPFEKVSLDSSLEILLWDGYHYPVDPRTGFRQDAGFEVVRACPFPTLDKGIYGDLAGQPLLLGEGMASSSGHKLFALLEIKFYRPCCGRRFRRRGLDLDGESRFVHRFYDALSERNELDVPLLEIGKILIQGSYVVGVVQYNDVIGIHIQIVQVLGNGLYEHCFRTVQPGLLEEASRSLGVALVGGGDKEFLSLMLGSDELDYGFCSPVS